MLRDEREIRAEVERLYINLRRLKTTSPFAVAQHASYEARIVVLEWVLTERESPQPD